MSEHDDARLEAAIDFIEKELKLNHEDIKITNTKLAPKPESKILWIETTESNVKKLYSRAAALKNKNVQLGAKGSTR